MKTTIYYNQSNIYPKEDIMRYSKTTILFSVVLISLFLLPAVGTAGFSLPSLPSFGYIPYIHWAPYSDYDKSDETNQVLSPDMAEGLAREYMDDRSSGSYNVGEIEDRGAYYLTEISGPDGKIKDILVIYKQDKDVKSLR
jgi:hypothetical protein